MAEHAPREHFIPLRHSDLVDLLCNDNDLKSDDRERFRYFCRLVTAIYRYEFYQRLTELKTAYAPFDPDSDTKLLERISADEEQRRLNDLFCDFGWLMERADFRHLSRGDIEPSLSEKSSWGIRMEVDFSAFERLAIFARGDVVQRRVRRTWRNYFRSEEVEVPVYQRLVLILKIRPERSMDDQAATDCVYLKIFKDIPKLDIKMLLPSTRVRMTKFDRTRIGFPLVSGLGLALYNIAMQVVLIGREIGEFIQSSLTMGTLWGIALGGIGYGYRSYYGYLQTKQRYRLTLTQSLYFQNLDNNSGVLFRLLDEAEDQECREVILAYFLLWHHAGQKDCTSAELNALIEQYLDRAADLKVAFEIRDAIAKLERLKILEKIGDRFRAVPLEQALEMLIRIWDGYFHQKVAVANDTAKSV